MDTSFLINNGSDYIDSLYQDFLQDPQSVDPTWRDFFQNSQLPGVNGLAEPVPMEAASNMAQELKVQQLIATYRERGHLKSHTNPIRPRQEKAPGPELEHFGLTQQDLSESFQCCAQLGGGNLDQAIQHLESIYCHHIGFEYCHLTNREQREWLQQEIESPHAIGAKKFAAEQQLRILDKIQQATLFEQFLGNRYVGQKRFSLEGGENTIPAVDAIISEAAERGVSDVIIGMAHRGRLNILSNVMGKTYDYILSEFEGMEEARKVTSHGDGDVKYHLGFKTLAETPNGKNIMLKLMPNPSHLEAVAPVVQGYARAKSDATLMNGTFCHPEKILPLIIHGDAALAGQGVVYETAQMSGLEGYSSGGTIHFVINNQIGFTTNFDEARTSTYCTDIAKVTNSPVIHVNGDDAQAVVYAAQLAVKYRQKFAIDVYIDMVCYRKHGHNESDEPKYTQPDFYQLIEKHSNPKDIYTQELIQQNVITADQAKKLEKAIKDHLNTCLERVRNNQVDLKEVVPDDEWVGFRPHEPKDFDISPETSVKEQKLERIHQAITTVPNHINLIKKSLKIIEDRKQRWQQGKVDWALAELYTYGSLLLEGHDIRLSGQDCIRGTFSHRHAGIFDQQTAEKYIGLNHIQEGQGRMEVHNSLLSEYAVMGFEYGYGLARPEALTIWEAQFGDFSNTAQTIVDQFLCSARSKWNINNGLMLFLPHGYEGQGPEHSSAKPERYLNLCAEFNMVVANCTTPASFFHLIRRQLKYPFRIPTVVFTPKTLLRHPLCISSPKDLMVGRFEEFIDDDFCDKGKVKRVLLCTGKIFYDLQKKQKQDDRKDVAIVRLEQLHPLPFERIDKVFGQYKDAEVIWVQEEPKNMGWWNYILRKLDHHCSRVISRKSSASPATGYMSLHLEEQQKLIEEAFSHG